MLTMIKCTTYSLFIVICLPTWAVAEPLALRCVYTQASFNAPYMSQPETRICPQGRCFYDLRFDTQGTGGSVNAVEGYLLRVDDTGYQLQRQARNRIVEGMDSASFRVNKEDLSYRSIKSTPPGVRLKTTGQCQTIE